MQLLELFTVVSKAFKIPSQLLLALCTHESLLNPDLYIIDGESPSVGLCSIKLTAAQEILPHISEDDLLDPAVNLIAASGYLRKKYNRYKNWDYAVLAYNSGSIRFNKHGEPFNKKYLTKVMNAKKHKSWKRYIK